MKIWKKLKKKKIKFVLFIKIIGFTTNFLQAKSFKEKILNDKIWKIKDIETNFRDGIKFLSLRKFFRKI